MMRGQGAAGRGQGKEERAADWRASVPLAPSPLPPLLISHLGTVPYLEALEFQRAAARARIAGRLAYDLLILLQHPPVVTLGRSSHVANLLMSREGLAARGVELVEVERGGDVTFHGPGQLVGYPIFDLKEHRQDLHWYLRQVEEALIRTAATFGLPATRNPGNTGVWTSGKGAAHPATGSPRDEPPDAIEKARDQAAQSFDAPSPLAAPPSPTSPLPPAPYPQPLRKLASIGVHAREWVTWHGFALNVTTDLRFFDLIVPCGLAGVQMTSLAAELGYSDIPVAAVEAEVAQAFGAVFQRQPRETSAAELSEVVRGAG